jgi:hypothetical protein
MNVIQVKYRRKTRQYQREIRLISGLGKFNELLTYAIRLDPLIVTYVQLVIMLMELKKVLSV